ncbi:hypothetical protein IQ250_27650, partial [Pseudanabaenaceae cyanobacterium LEGE 13415]|nr:hypothetical protein [Pseudanabaenaceae cyanobacterium LEGE 13415]
MVPTQSDAAIAILGGVITAILAFRVPRQELDRVPLSGLALLFIVYLLIGWGLAITGVPIGFWMGAAAIAMLVTFGSSIVLGRGGLIAFAMAGMSVIAMVLGQPWGRLSAITLALVGIWLWASGGARYRMERAGFRRSSV